MTDRPSVPLRSAAICGDCEVIFSMRAPNGGGVDCPKCASGSWTPVQSGRASDEIARLREQIALAIGVLTQIAYARFQPDFKVDLAKRTLRHFAQNETAPGGSNTPEATNVKGHV